jgi:hypothetical protein
VQYGERQRHRRHRVSEKRHASAGEEQAEIPQPQQGERASHAASIAAARDRDAPSVAAAVIVADQCSNWFITGAADPRWDDDDLNQLKTVPGTAFDVVQLGEIHHY